MSFDSKSLLAKLMATENLVVEERNVSTAYFDVKNRVLVVPILDKKISNELYDLFMGHEVGHALYTPLDGLRKAKDEKVNMSVLNVVEDARIEKKIKYKYPGLKNSFVKAYQELMQRNFFETADKNLNQMNLIDRINMHFKGGATLAIQFNEEERDLVKAVDTAETYEDVVEVTKRIVEYMQENPQDESYGDYGDLEFEEYEFDENSDSNSSFGEGKADEVEFDEETNSKSQDSNENSEEISSDGKKSNEKSKNSDNSKEKDEESDEAGDDSSDENDFDNENSNEIVSKTDEAYKKNESRLFSEDSIGYKYVNVPSFDPEKCIVDYKTFYDLYKSDGYTSATKEFNLFRKDSAKVVSYLTKEFEMRKNADQLKRASTAKTGELNMDRIFSYSFNEDIFKKLTIVPQGKSHGLVMFLDWSGSMQNHLGNTVKQLLNLVMFCKNVNIPFEVYCFISESFDVNQNRIKPVIGDYAIGDFGLVNVLSNRMSMKDFTFAAGALMNMSGIGSSGYHIRPNWFQLSGTPLNETIMAAMDIVPYFQKKNKLQVVNSVFLTDGEGHSISDKYKDIDGRIEDIAYTPQGKVTRIIVRDPKTRHQESYIHLDRQDSQTDALLRLLKKRTNAHVIGFYIASPRDFRNRVWQFFPETINNNSKLEEYKDQFRKNKFAVVNNSGFDDYYVLRSNGMDLEEDAEFVVKENATTRGLVSAFTKYAGARVNNRVILNRFIGLIA